MLCCQSVMHGVRTPKLKLPSMHNVFCIYISSSTCNAGHGEFFADYACLLDSRFMSIYASN